MGPTRRQVLKWGLGAGALAGIGLGGRRLLPPGPSAQLEPTAALAARLYDGLDEKAHAAVCFGYDHPLRQYHNRGVDTGGGWAFFLGGQARQTLVDLVHAGLSEKGRARIPEQWVSQIFGIHLTRLAIFGDPHAGPYQVLVTGPHLNLRLGGRHREGAAAPRRTRRAGRFATPPSTGFAPMGSRVPIPAASPDRRLGRPVSGIRVR